MTVNSLVLGPWLEALRPVRGKLTAPLAEIFRDKHASETDHSLATDILTDYAGDQPEILAESADGGRSEGVCDPVPRGRAAVGQGLPMLQAEIAQESLTGRETGRLRTAQGPTAPNGRRGRRWL